jgi:hypothetical protein
VFAASMADIKRALAVKHYTDPKKKMPAYFYDWLDITNRKEAERLLLIRGIGVNHAIKLEKDNNDKEKEVL